MFNRDELEAAHRLVTARMMPTPQYAWPQLEARLGCKVWVKHENHTPTGSFKVRGAFTFIDWLKRTQPDCPGIITATRGNHGQGQSMAATAAGMRAVIYAPRGNSEEKNAAMRAFGAELVEFGHRSAAVPVAQFSHGSGELVVGRSVHDKESGFALAMEHAHANHFQYQAEQQ